MKALLMIDIQNDFLPEGSLAVREGHKIIPIINDLMHQFDLCIASQDWHPEGHGSFAETHSKAVGEIIELNGLDQVMWPKHCVQGSFGAEFSKEFTSDKIDYIVQKGMDLDIDSYSAFFDNGKLKKTGLEDYLREKLVDELYVVGLATDYCVKFTVLDALSLGFKVHVILEGCRGVNVTAGDVDRAIEDMEAQGAIILEKLSSIE